MEKPTSMHNKGCRFIRCTVEKKCGPERNLGAARTLLQISCAIDRKTFYCTALIMSKIGKYMATTMPPTTTPRNTIITGSINESKFDTAASTSSS